MLTMGQAQSVELAAGLAVRADEVGGLGLGAWDLETGHAGAGPSQRRGSAGCLVREAGDGGWRCGMQGMAATSCDEWMDEGDGSGAKEVEEGRGETGAAAVRPGARQNDAGGTWRRGLGSREARPWQGPTDPDRGGA